MSLLGITCLRDDGPYIIEWIGHHLSAGFDNMLVLTHDCRDGSDALLDRLTQDSRIHHMPFKTGGKRSAQWQALRVLANAEIYQSSEWALFFDCDEFLTLPNERLPELINRFESASGAFDAVPLPWRLFGSAGHKRRGPGLTPERFTRSAPPDLHFPLAHLFKTLHRPGAFRNPGVHRPRARVRKPARWIGPDGTPLDARFSGNDKQITLYGMRIGLPCLWLNHYSLRSVEEFLLKRARGLPNHVDREIGLTYWAERNWNVVDSKDILPMMPATRKEIDILMSLPGVASAHAACLAAHDARYKDLMTDLDVLRLAFRLGFLTGSTPPTAAEARAFVAAQIQVSSNGRVS